MEILDSTELLACATYLKILFLLNGSKDIGNPEVEKLLIRYFTLAGYDVNYINTGGFFFPAVAVTCFSAVI